MRILITDSDDCLVIDGQLWRPLLALARQFGWRPAGTVMPVFGPDPDGGAEPAIIAYDHNWRGDYLIPKGQRIKSDDAMNLAGFLGLALRDIEKLLVLPPARRGAGPRVLSTRQRRCPSVFRHPADYRGAPFIHRVLRGVRAGSHAVGCSILSDRRAAHFACRGRLGDSDPSRENRNALQVP